MTNVYLAVIRNLNMRGFTVVRGDIKIQQRSRVSSVVEHSSANPKVSGSIPGLVSYLGHGL